MLVTGCFERLVWIDSTALLELRERSYPQQ